MSTEANKKIRIFVGMSGGVDSSVAAAMLKESGYDVTGVFLRTWQPDWIECRERDDRRDAMRAAAHLDIPFLTFDCEEEYKRSVADYMIEEYRRGRTPNPDVMCNRHVKFGVFLEKALEMGADYVATGHYARLERESDDQAEAVVLKKGIDDSKDQSYFLWNLSPAQLSRVIFPVGEHRKPQIRVMAQWFGLPNAQKKDSQGVCFLGKFDMRKFLAHYIPEQEGAVLDVNGKKIGKHQGAVFYTYGQRHGFEVTDKGPNDSPRYVVDKDVVSNTITVSENPNTYPSAKIDSVKLEQINWITEPTPDRRYSCRFRHRQLVRDCDLEFLSFSGRSATEQGGNGQWIIHFREPQTAVAPGQSLVIYDGDVCMGGGIIV